MATPMVAPEPFSLTGRLAGTFAQLDQNNAARAESAGKYRKAQMDNVRALAQALLTSGAAHSAFGGGQIAGMVGGQGMLGGDVFGTGAPALPEGALSGAYTSQADALRLRKMASSGRGGGGAGKPYKWGTGQFWRDQDGTLVHGTPEQMFKMREAGHDFTPILAPDPGDVVIDLKTGARVPFGGGGGGGGAGGGGESVTVGAGNGGDNGGGSAVEADPELELARQIRGSDYQVRRAPDGTIQEKKGPMLDYEGNAEWEPFRG